MSELNRANATPPAIVPERRQTAGRRDSDRERQSKAICPKCGFWDSVVMQGWADPRGYTRRRRCQGCNQNFQTRELVITTRTEAR